MAALTLSPVALWASDAGSVVSAAAPRDHAEDVALLVAYVAMAIGFSFLCSIAEAVLLSITPSYVEHLRESNPGRARRLKRLKLEKIDRSLAAILTLNTIAHTIGAIGAGAQANVVFGSYWFGVFSAVMTLLILFASEIVPKTLGAVFWKHLVLPTIWYIQFLIIVLFPAVWLSELLTRVIAFGRKTSTFSRDELDAMARMGFQEGHLTDKEAHVIRNLLRFKSLHAADIMTPRTVMIALDQEIGLEQAMAACLRYPFARVPVYEGDIDHITGFVMRYDILQGVLHGRKDETLASIRRDILFLPGNANLLAALEAFFDGDHHLAVLVDEYGGVEGLVSMEDIIETLIGLEIIDELDEIVDLQSLARERWSKRAKELGILTSEGSEQAT